MFCKNTQQDQSSFFNSEFLMPPKMRQQLQKSWAHTFRTIVFTNIPEEPFAVLFSEKDSRPNSPINVLVGADMLKDGFGWTDEEMGEHLSFDLLTRYALRLDDLGTSAPTLRTFNNHRKRVREHAEKSGVNLYEEVFNVITDEQLMVLELATGWQRQDSTQLLSNIARMNRLELAISVLQQGVKELPAEELADWQEKHGDYLQKRPQNICYQVKKEDVPAQLQTVGKLLVELAAELRNSQNQMDALELVDRIIREQYAKEDDGEVTVLPTEELKGSNLQSPHDPEATYRKKGDESYKGYVVNISETCDPENPVQLITSVQTASNNTDDGQLLAQSLDNQAKRGIDVDKVTVDGGYTGATGEQACDDHQVEMHPTRIRGGRTPSDRFGWDAYEWQFALDDRPTQVTCPGGQTAPLQAGRKAGRQFAHFDEEVCATCPFFGHECRVQPRKTRPPTLLVQTRSIQVARLRRRITLDNNAVRAAVEATIRSVKRPFAAGKLPVRGLIRAHMVVCGSALLVNLLRFHRYCQQQNDIWGKMVADSPLGSMSWRLRLRLVAESLFSWFLSVFWTPKPVIAAF